ncbi:MAG TPA: DinB family protein [Terriglobales bacterium]|nr:DinB family protein [Terriglobales bacterium]
MSQVPGWFERKFEFTFPLSQYPNLCVRLRGTPARMEETVRDVPLELMVRKPEGKWSAQEHVGHLLDLEPLWMARVQDFLSDGETLTVADLTNRKTHEADHNGREICEILAEFRGARMALLKRLASLDEGALGRVLVHPRLKQSMRLVDHLYFVAEHDDHHLAKMWEMVKCG